MRMTKILGWISGGGVALGSACLIGIMLLIVANVICRHLDIPVVGVYELTGFLIIVTVAFALPYTALRKGHVIIRLLASRFPQRVQAILEKFNSVIFLGVLAVAAWSSAKIIYDREIVGPGEYPEVLAVPYLPFRCLWLFGLLFFCLVLSIGLFKGLPWGASKKV